MKRILIMTMQLAAVWAVLAMLFYAWSKSNTENLAFPTFGAGLFLSELPAVCSVV